MKKKITFLTGLALSCAMSLMAAEIPVAAGTQLEPIIEAANDGDVFILADGEYAFTKAEVDGADDYIDLTKSVTIKAANPGKAELVKYQFRVDQEVTIGSIIIDGISSTFDETVDSKYFIQFTNAKVAIGNLEIKNAVISGYGRGVIRATVNKTAKIDNIVIDNSVFYGNSKKGAGYAQINPQKCSVKTVSIKNSTFYDSQAALFRNVESDVNMTVLIENCTVLNCGSSGGRKMIELMSPKDDVPTNVTSFVINNSIFSGSNDATAPTDKQIDLVNVGTINNCLLEGFSDPLTNRAVLTNEVAGTVGSVDFATFTLTTTPSTITGIGDPRWSLNGATSIADAIAEKEIQSVVYYDLLGRQLSGENATGLLIEKTIYTNGAVSSKKIVK